MVKVFQNTNFCKQTNTHIFILNEYEIAHDNPYCVLIHAGTLLMLQKTGIRSKLLAQDKNSIDTMFVDRRNRADFPNGNTLVSLFYKMCTS